jgi:hypothetical protein
VYWRVAINYGVSVSLTGEAVYRKQVATCLPEIHTMTASIIALTPVTQETRYLRHCVAYLRQTRVPGYPGLAAVKTRKPGFYKSGPGLPTLTTAIEQTYV